MPTAIIVDAPIGAIDHNPHRNLGDYPYIEKKILALKRSYAEVGMWPGGVIARKVGDRYEIAFGHHRVEAAKRSGLKTVPLTIQELSDKQMLGYMGRENMEDFNAYFLVMLETWEAAVKFSGLAWVMAQPTDIARDLGWVISPRPSDKRQNRDAAELNDTAMACATAFDLIMNGHMKREDLSGLTVREVRDICGAATKTNKQLAEHGKKTGLPREDIEKAQKHVGKAAVQTAKDKRAGIVARKDLRGAVTVKAYRFAKEAAKEARTPLFAVFAKSLATQISHWNNNDTVKDKINEMVKELPNLEMLEDLQALDRVVLALEHSVMRNEASIKKLRAKPAAVVKLRAIEGDLK